MMTEEKSTPRPSVSTSNPARELLGQLAALFPIIAKAEPLAIGIDKSLFERVPDLPRKHLRTALRTHTASTRYLKAVVRSPHRFDLDGQPAGEISEEQRMHAKALLDERFAKMATQRKEQEAKAKAQAIEARKAERKTQKLNALVEKFSNHKT